MGGKKDVMEAESVPGVPGVGGRWCRCDGVLGGGGRYVGTIISGRSMLEENEVMAKINNAKVPTLVAFSHAASISAGLRLGFSSKIGLT